MKKLIVSLLICMTGVCYPPLHAQVDGCGDGRYSDRDYFTEIDTVEGILFGSNTQVGGTNQQQLKMDVFMPANDTIDERPVVIFAFGGSFITGERGQVHDLCQAFAKMGYVAVTIDYRVGFFFPSPKTTLQAVMRGVHDMRAAIRYLHKDVEQNGNTYGIDTSMIIAGGVSAGAITAIHAAYLDDTTEVPPELASDFDDLGGLEGNSGNPGFPSTIHAVISFSGTIGDSNWITTGAQPIVLLHEDGDGTVPIGSGPVSVGGIPTGLDADGSRSIQFRLKNLDLPHAYKEYQSNSHVGYLQGTAAERDTAINFVMNFLHSMVVCKEDIASGIFVQYGEQGALGVYPNPTAGRVRIKWDGVAEGLYNLVVYNALGKAVLQQTFVNNNTVDLSAFPKGMYLLRLESKAGQDISITKKILLTN